LHLIDAINGTGVAIGRATSTDGVDWTKDANNPVLESTASAWDRYGVATPCVIKNSATDYKMWYTGTGVDYAELLGLLTAGNLTDIETTLLDSINVAIGYATSDNGTVWTKDASNPVLEKGSGDVWDKYGVVTPSAFKSDNTYYMWYTGAKIVPNTLLNFLRSTSSLEAALINGTNSAIGHATSANGTAWTKDTSNPVLSKGTGDVWDKCGIGAPSVFQSGNTYQMWYTGGKSDLSTLIVAILDGSGLATALGNTLIAIGHASAAIPTPTPAAGGGGAGGLPAGTISIADKIDWRGIITESFDIQALDKTLTFIKGTKALNMYGHPLTRISIIEEVSPPPPPADAQIIGFTNDVGPDGATFKPPITLAITYDPDNIPKGVNEKNLVIAMWDTNTGEWVVLKDCTVDPETHTASAPVSHFTAFAVLAYTRPAVFTTTDLAISPDEVDIGEEVTISVTVANTGDLADSYKVTLKIDEVGVATKDVTLAGGASQKVTFTTAKDVAGSYTVNVNGLSGTFVVRAAPVSPSPSSSPAPAPPPPAPPVAPPALPVKPINWWLLGGIFAASIIIGVAISLVIWRQRA